MNKIKKYTLLMVALLPMTLASCVMAEGIAHVTKVAVKARQSGAEEPPAEKAAKEEEQMQTDSTHSVVDNYDEEPPPVVTGACAPNREERKQSPKNGTRETIQSEELPAIR